MATEAEFYKEVREACEQAGIADYGRSFVEMTCLDNSFDAPSGEVWTRALETLRFFISCGQLEAASRNEL